MDLPKGPGGSRGLSPHFQWVPPPLKVDPTFPFWKVSDSPAARSPHPRVSKLLLLSTFFPKSFPKLWRTGCFTNNASWCYCSHLGAPWATKFYFFHEKKLVLDTKARKREWRAKLFSSLLSPVLSTKLVTAQTSRIMVIIAGASTGCCITIWKKATLMHFSGRHRNVNIHDWVNSGEICLHNCAFPCDWFLKICSWLWILSQDIDCL